MLQSGCGLWSSTRDFIYILLPKSVGGEERKRATHTVHVSSRLWSTAMTSCLMLLRFQTQYSSNSNNSNILFHDSVSRLNTYKASAIFLPSIISIARVQNKSHRSPLLSSSLGAASIVSSSLYGKFLRDFLRFLILGVVLFLCLFVNCIWFFIWLLHWIWDFGFDIAERKPDVEKIVW